MKRACMVLVGLCLGHGSLQAGEPDEGAASGDETLFFAAEASLWRMSGGSAQAVAQVGDGLVTRIEVADSGAAVLIEKSDAVLWARLGGGAAVRAEVLDCKPRARISPDGERVVCIDGRGHLALFVLRPSVTKTVLGPAVSGHFGFASATELITSDDKGIWAKAVGEPQPRKLLAGQRPDGAFLPAPGARRAVGVFFDGEQQAGALYTFRLDGKGVRRRLIKGAEPVAWSRDGTWLAVQRRDHGCLVRVAGGQYKCWRGYRAVGVTSDGSYILLVKPVDRARPDGPFHLYRGKRDGVKPEAPSIIRRTVDPAAAVH